MRISPISTANYGIEAHRRVNKLNTTPSMTAQQVSFGSWKGALGAVGGTLLGLGLGALTGGLGTALIAACVGCTIGGETCDTCEDPDEIYNGPSSFDFIG